MAQLSSPGVSVSVIDESFYTPAAPGTVPLIIVASEEGKQNGSATGTAPGTLKANAGAVYLLTSQKDLADTFGTPIFKTDASNNPVHAGEQNEYGLQAAYSYLGVSNRAFVVRADIDTSQLDASATAPAGAPEDGTYWFDTANTQFGIFEWNSAGALAGGQKFTVKYPTVITNVNLLVNGNADSDPLPSVGAIGSYVVVATTTLNRLYYKNSANAWVGVGSTEWVSSIPTATSSSVGTLTGTETFTINGSADLGGATTVQGLVDDINAATIVGVTAAKVGSKLELFSTGTNITLTGTLVPLLGLSTSPYMAPAIQISKHTSIPLFKTSDNAGTANGRATGSIWVKTTKPNQGADWIIKKYNAATGMWSEQAAPLYPTGENALANLDSTGGGSNLPLGAVYVKFNDDEQAPVNANFKVFARSGVGATRIISAPVTNSTFTNNTLYSVDVQESQLANDISDPVVVSFMANADAVDNINAFLEAFALAVGGNSNLVATTNASNQIIISHLAGGDIRLKDVSPSTATGPMSVLFSTATTANFYNDPRGFTGRYVASLWTESFDITPSADALTSIPADNALWYNSVIDEVDIMIHDGDKWVGYANEVLGSDPLGPQVSATAPKKQADGSTALVDGDLWISTADLENFPLVYKWNFLTKKWVLVDNSDQTTENGILFRDARYTATGANATGDASSIVELLSSDFLDPDAPDSALYPKGMLLWNLRRSGFNVKKFHQNYIDVLERNPQYGEGAGELMTDYYPHRWVSEAANQEDGSGTFGRKAQRKVVVQALQALVNANQQMRDEESRVFNLIACPGYPELVGEMVALNYDRGLTAFVVADTPARLTPDATSLNNWGTNQAGALEDNDQGLVSSDEYLGFFYPWGFTSDNIGNNVVVPPSHMMLRTIALSDNVSYPWFAPAGTRRGGITNATAVGYVDSAEGEFRSVALNNGQRDTLASIKVNPITFITGTGLVNYGQYTRARNASALDRINVARLVIYLRRQFAQLAKPYVFEPNDKITRDEIKQAAESLLLELVGQRALYDYLVVCDTSNNTPSRIDRNELYLDVAIEPVKAVEFIYIPLRLKNTGEIKGLG
jgi:hypothetical protein